MTIRRTLILEDHPGGAAEHSDAGKPLKAFQSITARCEGYGHVAVLDREALIVMSAVPSFGHLWRHAYCAPCRAVGATRTNVTLFGLLLDRNPAPALPAPRERLRADPTPNLPSRNIFDRRVPKIERIR